jgi:hypothetical protein
MSDFMLNRCGCVGFYVIRNSTTRICSGIEQSCFRKAEKDFDEYKEACKCYEPCDHMNHNFEIVTYGPSA